MLRRKFGNKVRVQRFHTIAASWLVLALLVSLVAWPTSNAQAADTGFGDTAFQSLWYRSDLPVLTGATSRSLLWGPIQVRKLQEPYKEAASGYRFVVYYDKGRQELTNPDADPTTGGYLTNGLLTKEMISGAVQLGDSSYRFTSPASDVAIAGDPLDVNPTAPTYASFSKFASLNNDNRVAQRNGAIVQETLTQDGTTGSDATLAKYNLSLTAYNPNLGHNVPKVFDDFFAQQGPIIVNGQPLIGPIMDSSSLIGFPITEPLWVKTKVAGQVQDVLVQAFERRVVTYTPSNPVAYQVEMGNTGQHYYRWRYKSAPISYDSVTTKNGGVVSTSHPLATKAGLDVLAAGGNAIDAAAAVQFALNVVEPQFSGIGGGGFMVIRLKDGTVKVIDSRESAPAGAKPTMFLGADSKPLAFDDAVQTGMAVGIPGTLKGVATAVSNYGTMSLGQTMQAAIGYARDGFTVNFNLAQNIAGSQKHLANRTGGNTAADVFLPNGIPLQEGATLKQPDLAKTLQAISLNGPGYLYGDTDFSQAFVKMVQARNGAMTIDDLKKYDVRTPTPVMGNYKGYDIVSMPLPSSGGLTMLQILKLLEPYDLKSMGQNSANALHLLIEASHLAFADRNKYLGDDQFVKVPKIGFLDPTYLNTRRVLINAAQTNTNVQPGNPFDYEPKTPGSISTLAASGDEVGIYTTHFTVADKDGNSVTYTTTIEQGFGSGMMVPGYGVMMNIEMTDFDFTPGSVNEVQPGKKPRSSMTPTVVLKDNKPFLILGSPGGATIILSVTQVLLNVLEFKMPLQQAIEAPRIFSSSYTGGVSWEAGLPKAVRDNLTGRGHKFATNPGAIGSVQAIMWLADGSRQSAADPRREGTVYATGQ